MKTALDPWDDVEMLAERLRYILIRWHPPTGRAAPRKITVQSVLDRR